MLKEKKEGVDPFIIKLKWNSNKFQWSFAKKLIIMYKSDHKILFHENQRYSKELIKR